MSHTTNAPINHLANHWAWFIYEHFSSKGVPVTVVAHSMGGLIVRHAIDAVQKRRSGYPPFVVAPIVLTLGTPHNGVARAFTDLCVFIGNPYSCQQMANDSTFIDNLRDGAQNPQAAYGTHWNVAGSHNDNYVNPRSAVRMSGPSTYKIVWASEVGIEHDEYKNQLPNDDPPFAIGAHCWSTTTGQAFDDLGEGTCWWPLQWTGALTFGPIG